MNPKACGGIWLLLGLLLQQFKISNPELITLDLALHLCFADGIAKTFLVVCVAMVIDAGAIHKIIFAFKLTASLQPSPFILNMQVPQVASSVSKGLELSNTIFCFFVSCEKTPTLNNNPINTTIVFFILLF